MGIHYESNNSKYPVLEAEMRRRLWWSFVLFDARISELSDYRTTILAPTWDCKIPLNVNDFDLRPEMKEPPPVQGKVTEGIFTLLRCEIGEFIRHSSFHLDFTNPFLKPVAKELPGGGNFDALEKMIEKGYLDHCDPHSPLHFMTIWMMRCTLSKYRLLQYYSRCSSGPPAKRQSDTAMLYAFRALESDTKIMNSPLTKGYRWLLLSYFPLPAYIHIVQELIKQPTRQEAKQAWEIMSDNYEVRFTNTSRLGSHVFKTFTKIILQAWEALEKAWKDVQPARQEPLVPPRIVANLKRRMAETAENEQNSNMEQLFGEFTNIEVTDLLMPNPMGFGNHNSVYPMTGPDNYSGAGQVLLPISNTPGQSSSLSTAEMHQMTWASMWGFRERRGW
jgi:hypothetical protein